MKVRQVFFLLACLVLPLVSAAQKVFIPEQGEGVCLNVSALSIVGAPSTYQPSSRANSVEFQVFREHVMGLSHYAIAGGLGYSGQYYHGNLRIEVSENGEQDVVDLSGAAYRSNRFATEYVDGLFELRYRGDANNKGRYTRIYVGGYAGYKTNAYSHFRAADYEVKYYHVAGFNPIRYGFYLKAGRGPLNLYANMGLSPLVTQGPMLVDWSEATSTTVGISLTL